MNWRQRVLFGLLLLTHLALLPLLAFGAAQQPHSSVVVIPLGVSVAQGVLASLWLVCLQESRLWRCASALALTSVSWLMVMMIVRPSEGAQDSLASLAAAMGPILLLLITSGFIAVVWPIARWEIILPECPGATKQQFSLRHGMVLVAAACIFLAVARITLSPWNGELLALLNDWDELLAAVLVFTLYIGINAMLVLPIFESLFLYKGKNLVLVFVLLIGVPTCGALMTAVQAVVMPFELALQNFLLLLLGINMIQLLTIGGTIIALRGIGVRFQRALLPGELPPGEGGERLQDAGSASTMAATGETSPLAIDR